MLKFTTKRDINGNRYDLIIDLENKTGKQTYNSSFSYSDFITISKTDRKKLIEQLTENGYKIEYV